MSRYPLAERPYEVLFICPVETPQATIDGLVEKIKAIVAKENGTFRTAQNWGRRRLTFPIKRHRDGQYIYVDFNGSPATPSTLTTLFRVTDFVLRHMIVEREEAPILPTPPAQASEAAREKTPETAPAAASEGASLKS